MEGSEKSHKYLEGMKNYKLTLGNNRDGLMGCADANWASIGIQSLPTSSKSMEETYHGVVKNRI